MSEVMKNLGSHKKISKKQADKEYETFLDDPVTFAVDEILGILGPRNEKVGY